MTRRLPLLATAASAAVFAPATAHAHLVETRLGDFYGGMLHPLTDLRQILPWAALAALAAFQGRERARWVVPVFPLALLAGGLLLEQVAPALPFATLLDVALVALTGLALAAAMRLPLAVLIALVTVMGLLHGYENAAAMAANTNRLLFLSGMTAVGYGVLTLGTGGAIAFLRGMGSWRPIALRASGSWVAAVGLMVLGLQFVTPAVH